MKIPLFIDFESKNGIHKHLELAQKRELIYPLYKKYSFIEKALFLKLPLLIQMRLNLWVPMSCRWGRWRNKINGQDSVVITAHYHTISLVKYLNKKFPNLTVHIFYFNPVAKDVPLKYFKNLKCKIWSFDKEDCEKYNLHYNNQFVAKENYEEKKELIKNDVVFIGTDKGRLNDLIKLEKQLKLRNIKTNFHIVSSEKNKNNTHYKYKNFLTYQEIVELEVSSKVILDYVQEGQSGQTIRPLEAIFLGKKILTNNQTIIEEPYYNTDFFFVLGRDKFEEINNFISDEKSNKIVLDSTYEMEGWLINFVSKKEMTSRRI